MSKANGIENGSLTPPLAYSLNANLSVDHQRRVLRILRRTRLMSYPRLSTDAKTLFTVAALCADANGGRSADAVKVALSDPAVLTVARSLMDQAVSQ